MTEGQLKTMVMRLDRVWAMPNAWTFSIKPIKELLEEEVDSKNWCDPFCGKNGGKYASIINDLASNGIDALDFLKKFPDNHFDGVLLDPPYSNRQVSEHYKKAGIKVTGWHTSSAWGASLKKEAARVTKIGGKVICFGWNSMGIGKSRGFEMKRILLVPHGGSKNDTIVTVEIKVS